jgi:hypothetical protein
MKMRPRGRATMGTIVCATLLLVTGCTASSSSTRSKPQPLLPSSAPSQAPLAELLVKTSYGNWGFAAHPASWRSYPFEAMGSLGGTIGFLSTDIVRDPCTHTASSISCGEAVKRLSPTGVLIRWGNVGSMSIRSISTFPGEAITVGGSEARLEPTRPATGACLGRGGALQVEGTVLRPSAADNFLQMDACFGPDANVTAGANAEAMFRSLTFTVR